MATDRRPFRFAHFVIACAATAIVWAGTACNGILGNAEREVDAGAADDASPDPSAKCPGEKYCSAIDSCGPRDDPSYGCALTEACEPCALVNATAKCGPTGCTVKDCFPGGFFECTPGDCVDLSAAESCGRCGLKCPTLTPLCAPSGPSTFACTAACVPPQQACEMRCVDVKTTVADCGVCGNDCRGPTKLEPSGGKWACRNAACALDCLPGFHNCPSMAGVPTCVRQDPTSCGNQCLVCPAGPNATPQCIAAGVGVYACGFACNASGGPGNHKYKQCPPSPGCVDIENDRTNCGDCGKTCVTSGGVACGCTNGSCATSVPTCHVVP